MRTGGELPRRRYSMPETVMRKYRLRQRTESLTSESSGSGDGGGGGAGGRAVRRQGAPAADKCSQTSPHLERIGWRGSFPSLATPSPRAWSSAVTSDIQTVSDKTTSTQDSTLSVPSSENSYRAQLAEDVETQVSLPERRDRNTSITGLHRREYPDVNVDIAVNIEADVVDETVVKKDESTQAVDQRSIAIQADNLIPDISVTNESESQKIIPHKKEESSQVTRREIIQEMDPLAYHLRRIRAEIACSGGNYEVYPSENPVVPRYSAVPRTNSMMVNASSVEYSSDSDLSLTDSLEDPDEYRTKPSKLKLTRHDERLVRGEVAMEQERRRLPKGRDAYAYFLSLTGEEETTIREYSVPDWLKERLRRREEEIKKVYEDKFSRHQQCSFIRRRKKTVKRIKQRTPYSSSERVKKQEVDVTVPSSKVDRAVHFDNYGNNRFINNVNNNNPNPGTSEKCTLTTLNGNNMGVHPKVDNRTRSHNNNHVIHNNINHNSDNNGNHNGHNNFPLQAERGQKPYPDDSRVQISEIIKIEMSDNLRTVITKEKQINLPADTNIKQISNDSIKREMTNTAALETSNEGNISSIKAELVDRNMLKSKSAEMRSEITTEQDRMKVTSHIETSEKKTVGTPRSGKEEEPRNSHEQGSKFKEATIKSIQRNESDSQINLDRKIANILINALEENTKAHQVCARTPQVPEQVGENVNESGTTFESYSKISVQQVNKNEEVKQPEIVEEIPKYVTAGIQTESVSDSDSGEESKLLDKTCNTEPYLVSIRIQTSDEDEIATEQEEEHHILEYEESEGISRAESGDVCESFESTHYPNSKLVDKACNTVETASISTQTIESILKSHDIINGHKKSKTPKKKEVQFPPQVIKQIITGTGEYKTVEEESIKGRDRGRSGGKRAKVSKGVNTDEENNKNIINNNVEIMSNRCHPTPFCKNVFPSKSHQKKTQVLELNVPQCSCHMCTLQKLSPRADPVPKSKIPQSKKALKDEKVSSKVGNKKGMGTKFQMFEVIPEERNSSFDSSAEEGRPEKSRTEEKGVLTETHLVDQVVQVGSHISTVGTNTEPAESPGSEVDREQGTQTDCKDRSGGQRKSSNLVIGRFRAESCSGGREDVQLAGRQYKGRASLSAGHLGGGHEELLTLSKGWINFYLLRDNFDLSDSNNDEPPSVGRRRLRTVEKCQDERDKVEEYTVEIHATPEPNYGRYGLLPNLRHSGQQTNGLPEIGGRSSPSTPEQGEESDRRSERGRTGGIEPLPGVRKSKRTRRLDVKHEAVLTERRAGSPSVLHTQPNRSVEVAHSEQSISSITSSTVILSESPPPQQLKLPEKKSSQRRPSKTLPLQNGSSWTVTVAGSSGSPNNPPPDVEMKLSFAKPARKPDENLLQYQVARPKRQGQMIEEFSYVTRNEKQAVQCVQDLSLNANHTKSCFERTRGTRDNFSYEEDYINRLSSRTRYSTEDGSEGAADLHITGLAITPEKKPRVPTQSERDILRPQRYKFTR